MAAGTKRTMNPAHQRMIAMTVGPMSKLNTWLYRISGGLIGGRMGKAPILLLTTRGRKSGQARTTPLLFLEDEGRLVIVASKGGLPKHPLWYRNLEANPEVEVQVGPNTRKMKARTASPEEKAALWPGLVRMYRPYQSYQERTEREIPVVILEEQQPARS